MGREIERKFLVRSEDWRKNAEGMDYKQGYISTAKEHTVRVRRVGKRGFLTIKGENKNKGISRTEFEYDIPAEDADAMLAELCEGPLIEKKRYKIEHKGLTWEVDEFFGDNAGLILAEVELESEDQQVDLPEWIGEEVSGDPRYYNANLPRHPWREWGAKP